MSSVYFLNKNFIFSEVHSFISVQYFCPNVVDHSQDYNKNCVNEYQIVYQTLYCPTHAHNVKN